MQVPSDPAPLLEQGAFPGQDGTAAAFPFGLLGDETHREGDEERKERPEGEAGVAEMQAILGDAILHGRSHARDEDGLHDQAGRQPEAYCCLNDDEGEAAVSGCLPLQKLEDHGPGEYGQQRLAENAE